SDTRQPMSYGDWSSDVCSSGLTVSYTASDVGSGLADVELWAKGPGETGYSKVATDSGAGIDNSFSYTAALGDGSYRFYTRAHDAAGNYEAVPDRKSVV